MCPEKLTAKLSSRHKCKNATDTEELSKCPVVQEPETRDTSISVGINLYVDVFVHAFYMHVILCIAM